MILITGGAGYIGSHCVLSLIKKGIGVLVLDNLSTGHIETIHLLKKFGEFDFIHGDLLDSKLLNQIFQKYKIDSVIHFAGFSQIPESILEPQKYFVNNVDGTKNLLEVMVKNNVKKIVFSSTASIYGEPKYIPVDENHPYSPINPYGETKLLIEKLLHKYDTDFGLKSVSLRYFNVAGADSQAQIGEWHENETHLIPNILKSVFNESKSFYIYGDDYDTNDGTCIRDYINVLDLIDAHLLALDYLNNVGKTNCFNLGTSNGTSVKEIFDICQKITGSRISVSIMPRREGDPAVLVSDNKKAKEILNWEPKKNIEETIISAYEWEKKLNVIIKNS